MDIFVAGVGTGGTISGVGEYLKSKNPQIKIVAVEPQDSPLLSKGKYGPHKLQGIGANFIPKCLNTGIYDEIITVGTDDAYNFARMASQKKGFWLVYHRELHCMPRCSWQKERKTAKKILLFCFPIPENVIFQQACSIWRKNE